MPCTFEVSAPRILLFLGPCANIQGTGLEICAVGTRHQFFVLTLARVWLRKNLFVQWNMLSLIFTIAFGYIFC